jgi:transglutaminase-like putative cysteine protease
VKEGAAGAKRVDLWIPVPQSDAHQDVRNLRIRSFYPHKLGTAAHGNKMAHLSVETPPPAGFSVTVSFDATRREHIQSRLAGGPPLARDEDPRELAQYLKPDRLVPLDDRIRGWAGDVLRAANARTDLEKARAIYNHVVATVKYDKSGKGWGRGDLYYACDERRGNCTDFHAIFIGYARGRQNPRALRDWVSIAG